ncbi:MAG TPA: XdhC family protein [Gaiella sp.]|uniref:XdhC family protein n=1 Tax=Gaiella sp. TaxID=2663207 RepID=UPI002D80720E|nr:XdhC family protein [Gaiella sp.]HET9289320.1 XdhC family protein [Gaiella sp.]
MSDPRPGADRGTVLVEAGRLAAEGTPFALATVVSVRRPASARRGDRGIVTADGRLVGWVGGACSEPAVVREALHALAEGTTRLLRICPPGSSEGEEGVVVAESSCASEGTVEVLIEPQLPQPLLAVVGDSPAAVTLRELAAAIGWRVTADLGAGAEAIVVATMGRGDTEALDAALATPAGYVGLVASARRAGVELAALRDRGLDEATLARVRSPAGLDLGPLTQPEIAVAVLAELVAWHHDRGPLGELPVEAVDPVCGMTVAVGADTPSAEHEGSTYWFCCPGCRGRFARNPAKYLASA